MKFLTLVLLVGFSSAAQAKLNVVTTLSDLKSITTEVGSEWVNVDSIAKGTQDPHFIEAKPSFMVKAGRADLIIAIGLELEVGWLPGVINGARNPKVNVGQKGYLEVGPLVSPLEVVSGSVTRADGDVHPSGNPHVTLDPIRAGEIAIQIGNRLSELDAEHAVQYKANALKFQNRMKEKTKLWQARITKSGVKKIVSYHKTLTYFFSQFHLENPAILEPKPGIPPTSAHIINVIKIIQEKNVPLIMVENYFDPTVTEKIKTSVPAVRSVTVPVSVEGAANINSLDDLYEALVNVIEGGKV